MSELPSFQFINNSKSDVLDVILHGGSKGIESPFMKKLFNLCEKLGHSVVVFNFPYLERGEENSSGPELKEEIEVLKSILNFCEAKSYKQIRLIGKSLGGIVSSYFLRELPKKEHGRYSVVILGYITGHVDLKDFRGKITIIQGGKDKFGNIEVVKKDLRGAESKDISFFEIPNADHSYRDPKTKDPKYENRVVELLFH